MKTIRVKGTFDFLWIMLWVIFLGWSAYDGFKEYYVSRHGVLQKAVVVSLPKQYGKIGRMTVEYGWKDYEVQLRRHEFDRKLFHIGDTISIRKHPDFDIALRDYEQNGRKFWFPVILLAFILGMWRYAGRKGVRGKPVRGRTKSEKRKTRKKRGLKNTPGAHSPKFP